MRFVDAELTKISINTYVTTKISFANMLADICDHLPGADVGVVAATLGCDSRIGGKYLSPGLGYGGPCFPRDNVALAALARRLGASADLAEATDRINDVQPARILKLVKSVLARGTVGILGLSYKPNTAVVERSQGVDIAALLGRAGYRVVVFDPEALPPAMSVLGNEVEAAASAEACVAAADLVIIATPWPAFRDFPLEALQRTGRRHLPVIDCWRTLPPAEFGSVVELIYPGNGPAAISERVEPVELRLATSA
jgi:UDPglucose 6-dehydrogenase